MTDLLAPFDYCGLLEEKWIWATIVHPVFQKFEIPEGTRSVTESIICTKRNVKQLVRRIRMYVWFRHSASFQHVVFQARVFSNVATESDHILIYHSNILFSCKKDFLWHSTEKIKKNVVKKKLFLEFPFWSLKSQLLPDQKVVAIRKMKSV